MDPFHDEHHPDLTLMTIQEVQKARAARFGMPTTTSSTSTQKEKVAPAPSLANAVDAAEEEKRKKRAARFGTNPSSDGPVSVECSV